MLFSAIVCVLCQCLLLCCNTLGAHVNDGIVISFGKNIRPAKIEDKDRVVFAPSSSRLRCFAKCARDPHCSKCVRYTDDGTEEEVVVNKVQHGGQPHTDGYVLKCVMGTTGSTSDTDRGGSVTSSSPSSIQDVIDQSTPLIQNVNHIPPSTQGAENPSPPSRDIDKSGTEAVSSVEYKVVTETGRTSDSGTASYVYLILHGVSDSEELYLNHKGPEMVPESVDTFRFSRSKDLGGIRKMEIQMKAYMGMKSNWFCVKLEVERRRQYTSYTVVEMYSSLLNQRLPRELGEDWMFETPRDIPFNLTKQFTHPN